MKAPCHIRFPQLARGQCSPVRRTLCSALPIRDKALVLQLGGPWGSFWGREKTAGASAQASCRVLTTDLHWPRI